MPANTMSIGHDVSVDILDNVTGKMISFPAITGFSAEAITKQLSSEPINAYPFYAETANGWRGTIDFDRTDATVDTFFANREAAYYRGVSQFSVTINETIREQDGTISQFKYVNCALKPSQLGNWKGSDKVSQRIDWIGSTRVKVV